MLTEDDIILRKEIKFNNKQIKKLNKKITRYENKTAKLVAKMNLLKNNK